MLTGLPGTGKSTTGKLLRDRLEGFSLISQNDVRRDFGMTKMTVVNGLERQGHVLREVDVRTAKGLLNGNGSIIDAAHRFCVRRQQVYGVGSACGAHVLALECACSEETAKGRMNERPKKSDGLVVDSHKSSVYDRHASQFEKLELDFLDLPAVNHVSHIVFDTEKNTVDKRLVASGAENFIKEIEEVLTRA